MGSGTNRSWWKTFGTRSARRKGTKSIGTQGSDRARLRIKAARAEAARRSQPEGGSK